MNNCDICNVEQTSESLIWLTSEDFKPKTGEIVRWDYVKNNDVDAVCKNCYTAKCLETNKPLTGTVFYASAKAMRDRYMKEGKHVTISSYRNYQHLTPNFVQVNLNGDPTNYIHLTLDSANLDDICYECDAPCSSTSEYQDDGRVFCSLDCVNTI